MAKRLFAVDLYKNFKEPLFYDMPLEWIDEVIYNHDEINEFNIVIPRFINSKENPIYNKIKSGHQIVVTERNGITKTRYMVCNRQGIYKKESGTKTFTCYQFQKKLSQMRIAIPSGNYSLIKDTINIADGVLDYVASNSGWTIGEVSEKARLSDELVDEYKTLEFSSINKANVQYDDILIDMDVALSSSINQYGKNPLYVNFTFENVHTEDFNYNTVYNNMEIAFDKDIKHVTVKYHSEPSFRHSLEYIFTMSDDSKEVLIKTFVNCTNETLQWDKYTISYSTGNQIKEGVLKFPYFDTIDSDIYKFLQDIETAYFCVFEFDTMNRVINCYSKEDYGVVKGLELSMDSNCLEIKDNDSVESITGIKVIGKSSGTDNKQVSIVSENIYGSDIIYDFTQVIADGLLSEECVLALSKYTNQLQLRQSMWLDLKTKSMDIENSSITLESALTSLNDKIKYQTDLLSAYVSAKDSVNQALAKAELDGYTTQLNAIIVQRTALESEKAELVDTMNRFSTMSTMENIVDSDGNKIFSSDDLRMINEVNNIEVISDDYYSTNYSLYNAYVKILADKIKPTVDFNITSDMVKYLKINNNLIKEGNLYPLSDELAKYLGTDIVRLTQIKYIPKNDQISNLSYSNKEKKSSVLKGGSTTRKVNAVSNTLNSFMKTLSDAQFSNNYVSKVMEEGLNLATATVNGRGSSCVIDMGGAGIFVKSAQNENEQIYVGSGIIAISDDSFATSKTCIDKNGVIAKYLIGQIILGNELVIESDNGCFEIKDFNIGEINQQFGLKIYSKTALGAKSERIFLGVELVNGVYVAKLRLIGDSGQLNLSEKGILSTDSDSTSDNLDSDHPMTFTFRTGDTVTEIRKSTLILNLMKFRTYTRAVASSDTLTSLNGGLISTTSGSGGYSSNTYGTTSNSGLDYVAIYTDVDYPTPDPAHPEEHKHHHLLCVDSSAFSHTHSVTTTVSIPNHNHSINVESHNHTIPSHNHVLEQGVFESTKASDVSVYINNVLVQSGINSDYIELDITNFLQVNTNNIVKITSKGLGRVQATIWGSFWNSW